MLIHCCLPVINILAIFCVAQVPRKLMKLFSFRFISRLIDFQLSSRFLWYKEKNWKLFHHKIDDTKSVGKESNEVITFLRLFRQFHFLSAILCIIDSHESMSQKQINCCCFLTFACTLHQASSNKSQSNDLQAKKKKNKSFDKIAESVNKNRKENEKEKKTFLVDFRLYSSTPRLQLNSNWKKQISIFVREHFETARSFW